MDVNSIQGSLTAVVGSKVERTTATGSNKQPDNDAVNEQAVSQSAETEAGSVLSRDQVEAAVATIQDFVQSVRRDINFSLEEGGGRVVVKVTDAGSGDVIRQIPSEEALQLAENLSEVRSLLFKAEA